MNHFGRVFHKHVTPKDGGAVQSWMAARVEPHLTNTWNFCHGGALLTMAEAGVALPAWDPAGPPLVAVDMTMQFIAAPKLGDLVEVCGTISKRTRTLCFTRAEGYVNGEIVFIATSIQKTIVRSQSIDSKMDAAKTG